MNNFAVKEIEAKSILQKSGLPDADWVINPYTGCRFGCKYCYAAFVGRFWHPGEEWGSYVDAKVNASALLKEEILAKLKGRKKRDIGSILLSSVTDPYQGLEAKYRLTRGCLEVLAGLGYEGSVSILTKSQLVLRDVDVLKKLKRVTVGLTVTSTGDTTSKYLETFASPNEMRIDTLKKLHAAGVKTYAFVGPLLPHFAFLENRMESLFKEIKSAGVGYIYLEHINLSPYIRDRLIKYLKKDYSEELRKFQSAQSIEYRQKIDQMLSGLVTKYSLKVAHGKPIYHKNKDSWKKVSGN